MIPKDLCRDRFLYRINSRNLLSGVYRSATGGFIGIRAKFGDLYLFEEYHHDNGMPFGTVFPLEELEKLPDGILLKESLGSFCSKCEIPTAYVNWAEGGNRTITLKSGGTMEVQGQWQHLEPTDCPEPTSYGKSNVPLFDWLKEQDERYKGK